MVDPVLAKSFICWSVSRAGIHRYHTDVVHARVRAALQPAVQQCGSCDITWHGAGRGKKRGYMVCTGDYVATNTRRFRLQRTQCGPSLM
jgi:hypothetical protein